MQVIWFEMYIEKSLTYRTYLKFISLLYFLGSYFFDRIRIWLEFRNDDALGNCISEVYLGTIQKIVELTFIYNFNHIHLKGNKMKIQTVHYD